MKFSTTKKRTPKQPPLPHPTHLIPKNVVVQAHIPLQDTVQPLSQVLSLRYAIVQGSSRWMFRWSYTATLLPPLSAVHSYIPLQDTVLRLSREWYVRYATVLGSNRWMYRWSYTTTPTFPLPFGFLLLHTSSGHSSTAFASVIRALCDRSRK